MKFLLVIVFFKSQTKLSGHPNKNIRTNAFTEVLSGEQAILGQQPVPLFHLLPQLLAFLAPRLADESQTLQRPLRARSRPFNLQPLPPRVPRRRHRILHGGCAGLRRCRRQRPQPRELPPNPRRDRQAPRDAGAGVISGAGKRRRRGDWSGAGAGNRWWRGVGGGIGSRGDVAEHDGVVIDLQRDLDELLVVVATEVVEEHRQHGAVGMASSGRRRRGPEIFRQLNFFAVAAPPGRRRFHLINAVSFYYFFSILLLLNLFFFFNFFPLSN